MSNSTIENIILVTAQTRLSQLVARFNTLANARFYLERKKQGNNFNDLVAEDLQIKRVVKQVQNEAARVARVKMVDKSFLPNFIFTPKDLIIVIGQDGLVANVAKYAKGIPILGINPEPERFDGILLPFHAANFKPILQKVAYGKSYDLQAVTMAKVELDDGQKLLAFNDLFIGPQNHSSARYILKWQGKSERQSSSGLIVSTGAGSTGWMSSLLNMANGLATILGNTRQASVPSVTFPWSERKLLFVVREPFQSRTSQINIVAGGIDQNESLTIESLMPESGVIFSDGIQEDFLRFTSGMVARVSVADEVAQVLVG